MRSILRKIACRCLALSKACTREVRQGQRGMAAFKPTAEILEDRLAPADLGQAVTAFPFPTWPTFEGNDMRTGRHPKGGRA